jgi:hypothetical protein
MQWEVSVALRVLILTDSCVFPDVRFEGCGDEVNVALCVFIQSKETVLGAEGGLPCISKQMTREKGKEVIE